MAGIPNVRSGQSSATAGKTPYGNGEMVRASSPPRRARTTKIIAVAVASTLAIATVCVVVYRTLRKPETPSASASAVAIPTKPALRTVRVVTNPPGARVVSADGRDFGTTPVMIDGLAGTSIDVRLTMDGYATKVANVRFNDEEESFALSPNIVEKPAPPSPPNEHRTQSTPAKMRRETPSTRRSSSASTTNPGDVLPSNPLAD
jgi:hypothetical protein